MKYPVTLLVLGVVVCALPIQDELKAEIRKAHAKCENEEGLERDTAKKILKGDITDEEIIGSFVLCVGEKLDIIDNKGKLDKKNIEEKLEDVFPDKDAMDKAIEKCAVEEDTPEETAVHLAKCMTKEINEHGTIKIDMII